MDRKFIRMFQKMKGMSNMQFWHAMNNLHTKAYAMGMNHMKEAMGCHPRISKPMIEQVYKKAEEIREQWDGLKLITVEDTEDVEFKTATELIHNLTATEAYIFNLKEEAVIYIAGRNFKVQPVQEEGQDGNFNTETIK